MKPLNYNHTVTNADGTHARLCDVSGGGSSGGGGLDLTILYTNPTPSSGFAERTVTIGDVSEYKFIMVGFIPGTSSNINGKILLSNLIPVSNLTSNNFIGNLFSCGYNDNYDLSVRAIFSTGDATKIKFKTGYKANTENSGCNIPCHIYGVK